MSLYYVLKIMQYITIIGTFIEIRIIVGRWKNSVHTFLFLSCVSLLINSIGYLLEMNSKTEESYITALKFSYFGRIWYAFFLFLFVAELVKIKIPTILKNILMIFHLLVYHFIVTLQKNTLYYSEYHYNSDGIFPKLVHSNGILHHVFVISTVTFIVIGISWLIRAYNKERKRIMRGRIVLVLLPLLIESAFFIVQVIGIPGLTDVYDITMIGYFAGNIIMLIAFFSFDLLGTGEIAKEYMIDRISEGIIAVDEDGVVQYYNEPAKELYPCLEHNLISDLRSVDSDRGRESVLIAIRNAVRDGEKIVINQSIYSPEENDLMSNGKCVGKIYALVNETEHYKLLEALQEQKVMADNANAEKSRFLANMSHEIRTPINAMLGMNEMVLRETDDKTVRSYAMDIKSAGRTLLSIINDILDFSKIEQGKIEIVPAQYELSSLINDLVNIIKDRVDKKGLEFRLNVKETIPHVLIGDEIRIRQCVINILTNAVKYTEHGYVSMHVDCSEHPDEKCIFLKFSIEDTGIGMKKEDLERLFSPYERFDLDKNRYVEGTGLGMSITRKLLALMDSELEVKSVYGKGSVFTFSVKQEVVSEEQIGDFSARMKEKVSDSLQYKELFRAPEAQILVVDDTDMNLIVIKNLLKKTEIQIDTAISGEEAVNLSSQKQYDVLFIDHMMPGLNGIDTLKAIKKSGKNMNTPAISLTANAISGAREMYLDAGFSDYLSKPVDGDKLEELLYKLIPKNKIKELGSDEEEKNVKTTDRLGNNQDSPLTEADDEPERELPSWLVEMPEIDCKAGIKNCGSEEGFLSVIRVFGQTAETKASEIEAAYSGGDISLFTIRVHALKSSARIIGAAELSELAEKLEKAGKKGELSFVKDNIGMLMELYRGLSIRLKRLNEDDSSLPVISKKALKEAYQTISEIAQSMDYGLMDGIISELNRYHLEAKDKENVQEIENYLTMLDWDSIIQITRRALQT